jgi:hypothetical protein
MHKDQRPIPPKAWEMLADRFGIDRVHMEKFLRWVHGNAWAASKPSEMVELAKKHGIDIDQPMAETLMQLYQIYREETDDGEAAADTG